MSISLLPWDFGDTLVDERWMRLAPLGCTTWERSWVDVMAELADDWNLGAVTSAVVFQTLAGRTGMRVEDVEAHARHCCRQIKFHPSAWRYARSRCRPQALVTVNPDLFVDYVVPLHNLTAVFDVVIVSATEHRANKVELCEVALARLDFAGDRSEALLIDNRRELVRAWEGTGGAGYWFRDDNAFHRDLPVLLEDVHHPSSRQSDGSNFGKSTSTTSVRGKSAGS